MLRLTEIFEKRSLISTIRHTVHTNPSRKRSSMKTLSKSKEFEICVGARFNMNGRHFENTMTSTHDYQTDSAVIVPFSIFPG